LLGSVKDSKLLAILRGKHRVTAESFPKDDATRQVKNLLPLEVLFYQVHVSFFHLFNLLSRWPDILKLEKSFDQRVFEHAGVVEV